MTDQPRAARVRPYPGPDRSTLTREVAAILLAQGATVRDTARHLHTSEQAVKAWFPDRPPARHIPNPTAQHDRDRRTAYLAAIARTGSLIEAARATNTPLGSVRHWRASVNGFAAAITAILDLTRT